MGPEEWMKRWGPGTKPPELGRGGELAKEGRRGVARSRRDGRPISTTGVLSPFPPSVLRLPISCADVCIVIQARSKREPHHLSHPVKPSYRTRPSSPPPGLGLWPPTWIPQWPPNWPSSSPSPPHHPLLIPHTGVPLAPVPWLTGISKRQN